MPEGGNSFFQYRKPLRERQGIKGFGDPRHTQERICGGTVEKKEEEGGRKWERGTLKQEQQFIQHGHRKGVLIAPIDLLTFEVQMSAQTNLRGIIKASDSPKVMCH